MHTKCQLRNHRDNTSYILKRLIVSYVKPYSNRILLAIVFMIISAACSVNSISLMKPTIDQLFLMHDRQMLLIFPLMMVATYCVKGIAEYYQAYLIKFVGQRILTDLQIKMYEHLLFADINFIHSQSSGRLISRFTNDILIMRGALSHLLVGCAKHFLSILFLVILMFKLEPILSCIVFIVFPIAIYPVQKLGQRIRKIADQTQEEFANYTAKLDETFQSIKIIKSFAGETIENNRAIVIANNILNFYKKTAKLDALVSPIMEILSGVAIGGIIWYGGLLVIEGTATPGGLLAFISAFIAAYRPFKSLVSLNTNLQEGIVAAKRVFDIFDTKPNIRDYTHATHINFVNPEIVFHNVELKLNSKTILQLINLKLAQGKTTAFVGCSGSGKTTLTNLLVRFYDPSHGQIFINNCNIKDIKINSLRQQISLVTQDIMLFDTTITENIAYSNSNATKDEIIKAAQYADAHEFILRLPQGYDTIIGVQGFTLSGGQRQRLSIARAFLKNVPILIWDEATSSLDQNSEQFILNSLIKLRHNKTTIVITHRLSTLVGVDNIIVMKSGLIVEQGTHQQLIQNKMEYYKLYNQKLKEN